MKKTAFGIPVLVLAVAVMFGACSSGGNNTPVVGTQPAKYSTPDDAASSASTAGDAASTVSSLAGSLDAMSRVTLPSNLSPRLNAKAGLLATGKTDPQVKALLDKVASLSKTTMMQKALGATKALKMSRTISINTTYDAADGVCTTGGSMTIVGSNNSDDPSAPYYNASYTITFNNCDDGSTVANGSFTLHGKYYYDNSSITISESMTNLTFYDSIANDTVAINASYGMNLSEPDLDHFTESVSANGYIADTDQYGAEMKFKFNSVSEKFTYVNDSSTGHETSNVTINGGMHFTVKDNIGTVLVAMSISATNFSEEILDFNDAAGTEQEWLSGTVALSWTPVLGACAPGSVTFKTIDPITFTSADILNPISGTLKVNSALVEFATPTFPEITVTLSNGNFAVYADMAALEAVGSYCSTAVAPAAVPPSGP